MPKQSDLINLFSSQWEERCRTALEECCKLEGQKIPETERWWRIKQLLNELVRPERRKKPRRKKENVEPVVESKTLREKYKLDFHSQEWIDKCAEISSKCAEIDNSKIPEKEKLWRTRQLLKELTAADKKNQKLSR